MRRYPPKQMMRLICLVSKKKYSSPPSPSVRSRVELMINLLFELLFFSSSLSFPPGIRFGGAGRHFVTKEINSSALMNEVSQVICLSICLLVASVSSSSFFSLCA